MRCSSLLLLLLLILAGCTTVPQQFEQPESSAWITPETTRMGAFFLQSDGAGAGRSGVRLLPRGDEAFITRFALAAQAEHTLDLQYYLWKGDTTGQALLHQVLEAADRGVRVRILIDDIYHSGRDQVYAAINTHPQVEVRVFNPVGARGLGRNLNFIGRKGELNHRMHNKIFLADNAVAILGGRNIGDDYFGIDPKLNFRDLDVLTVGPAAREAGAAFDDYWNSRRAVPIEVIYQHSLPPSQLLRMRTELDARLSDFLDAMPYRVPLAQPELEQRMRALEQQMVWAPAEIVVDTLERFEGGETSAFVTLAERLHPEMREEVVVQTAYLIPTQEGIDAIAADIDRGVRYRVMTNSLLSNNHLSVHGHYKKYRKPLLEAGVELYELRADAALLAYYDSLDDRADNAHAGLHTKAFVIDRRYSMIGSFNMDPRSRIWNSEIGLLVDSEAFAERVLAEMDDEFAPGTAYRLSLDERGKVRWTLDLPDGAQSWSHDPEASLWKRFLATLIGWLPIEQEL